MKAAKTTSYRNSSAGQSQFTRDVQSHFTWGYHRPSPFISFFSDKDYAENWACSEAWRKGKPVEEKWTLLTIDTSRLFEENVYLFKLGTLVEEFKLEIPNGAQKHIRHAYICLNKIPITAITKERNPNEVKEDRRIAKLEVKIQADIEADARAETYFGYDSDDSAIVNNCNDNIMRIIEGDWD